MQPGLCWATRLDQANSLKESPESCSPAACFKDYRACKVHGWPKSSLENGIKSDPGLLMLHDPLSTTPGYILRSKATWRLQSECLRPNLGRAPSDIP